MKQDILEGVRGAVQDELKPMKQEIATVKKVMASVEDRVGKVEAEIKDLRQSQNAACVDEKLEKRIKDVEEKLTNAASKAAEDSCTLLFGGLQGLSFEKAKEWVSEHIKERRLEEPEEMYHKGEEFNGILFTRFSSEKVAESIAKRMSLAKLKVEGEKVWCKKDLPIATRVALSFLLGVRRQLLDWKFTKGKVHVIEETLTLEVAGKPRLSAAVRDMQLHLNWVDEEWKTWDELQESQEMKLLKDKAEETLRKAGDAKGKGDGKGKNGH